MAYLRTCNRNRTSRRAARPHGRLLRGVLCLALGALAATSVLMPSRASAQESGSIRDTSPHVRPQMVSVFTGFHFGYFAGYGFPLTIAGRYYLPLVHDGFIPTINDEFGIEFGLDLDITFGRFETFVGFGVPVDAMWDFHFSEKFDAYGKLGLVMGNVFSHRGYGGFWWTMRTAVGLRLKLNEVLYFRAEVGYPSLLAGLGFAF